MTDLKNLSNRPFLIVDAIQRPAAGVNTSQKGWASARGNWQISERPRVEDRVNHRALTEAQVIIDILRGKVVKNRFLDRADDEVCEHYLGKYMNECKQALDVWLTRQAKAASYNIEEVRKQAADARAADAAAPAPATVAAAAPEAPVAVAEAPAP